VALAIWAFRIAPRGARLRKAAAASVFFMVTEALVGAGLVLLELVGQNSSMLRAGYLAVHLTNTFCLLASLGLVLLWAPPFATGLWRRPHASAWIALALILVTGVTGAITALGDTLFPSGSLVEGLARDRDPAAHLLLRLRVIHPALALVTAAAACWAGLRVILAGGAGRAGVAAKWLVGLALGQVAVGLVNLLLLVPIATQLLHLAVADLLWLAGVATVAAGGDPG
jgi:cytochrome c oxidase assembly protein subunit 15